MQSPFEKIKSSLDKVDNWIIDCLAGKYRTNELILSYLNKREKILQKTRKKLIIINRNGLINWES